MTAATTKDELMQKVLVTFVCDFTYNEDSDGTIEDLLNRAVSHLGGVFSEKTTEYFEADAYYYLERFGARDRFAAKVAQDEPEGNWEAVDLDDY